MKMKPEADHQESNIKEFKEKVKKRKTMNLPY